ncbi:MAG: two-component regulator propeller domain-containing protein, partial [Calditrichaceae bacterium]
RCSKKKQLWIGTGENGLNKFDIIKGKFSHYSHNPQNSNSLTDNSINTLYEDDDSILWIGTSGGIS